MSGLGRVVAVGTTALRTLESASLDGTVRAGTADTRLFIVPGYRFLISWYCLSIGVNCDDLSEDDINDQCPSPAIND